MEWRIDILILSIHSSNFNHLVLILFSGRIQQKDVFRKLCARSIYVFMYFIQNVLVVSEQILRSAVDTASRRECCCVRVICVCVCGSRVWCSMINWQMSHIPYASYVPLLNVDDNNWSHFFGDFHGVVNRGNVYHKIMCSVSSVYIPLQSISFSNMDILSASHGIRERSVSCSIIRK